MNRDTRKRNVHFLNRDCNILCNPRDKEAAHRALHDNIATTELHSQVTCKKCLQQLRDGALNNAQRQRRKAIDGVDIRVRPQFWEQVARDYERQME